MDWFFGTKEQLTNLRKQEKKLEEEKETLETDLTELNSVNNTEVNHYDDVQSKVDGLTAKIVNSSGCH